VVLSSPVSVLCDEFDHQPEHYTLEVSIPAKVWGGRKEVDAQYNREEFTELNHGCEGRLEVKDVEYSELSA